MKSLLPQSRPSARIPEQPLLHHLLWEGKTPWQLPSALLGSFLGLFLLLLSIQLYQDVHGVLGGDGNAEDQYLLINKRINLFNTLGASAAFSEEEIEELERQAFVERVGVFTPNRYRVAASSALLGFYTELFFESVAAEYVDFEEGKWTWEKGDQEVPILLSRDYLALYNFGFAPSQGLPQFTASTIRRVSFDLKVRGNGLEKVFQGRIVGFSDRINSILVPEEFMAYANATFGGQEQAKASRLILVCENIYDQELEAYLEDHNYELSRGRFIGGQLGSILSVVLGLIALIGFILLGLSLLVVLLNFQLLIAQSAADIRRLLGLGYPLLHLRRILHRRLLGMYGAVLVLVLLVLWLGRKALLAGLVQQGLSLESGLHWSVWLVALAAGLALFYLNYFNIKKRVEQLAESAQ